MTISRMLVGPAVVVLLLWAAPAAGTCTIATTSMAFGTYDVFVSPPTDSTAVITFRCDKKSDVTIYLDTGGSTTFSQRLMMTTGDQIGYNLYVDAARSNVWGDGTGGTSFYIQNNEPKNVNINVTVYGRVPGGQDVSAGAYADTVVATINF